MHVYIKTIGSVHSVQPSNIAGALVLVWKSLNQPSLPFSHFRNFFPTSPPIPVPLCTPILSYFPFLTYSYLLTPPPHIFRLSFHSPLLSSSFPSIPFPILNPSLRISIQCHFDSIPHINLLLCLDPGTEAIRHS